VPVLFKTPVTGAKNRLNWRFCLKFKFGQFYDNRSNRTGGKPAVVWVNWSGNLGESESVGEDGRPACAT
jgi:hypothetical protein